MAQISVYGAVANAAARLSNGRERRLLDKVVEMIAGTELGLTIISDGDDSSTQKIGPICPHCKREPVTMTMRPIQFGMFPSAEFSCSGCRKVISVSLMPLPPQMPMQQENPSSLILPRM